MQNVSKRIFVNTPRVPDPKGLVRNNQFTKREHTIGERIGL
jgi:hypothetical protein